MAVVARHGVFHTEHDKTTHFSLHPGSEALEITLMSRNGVLPEADFYRPIPWEPLEFATLPPLRRPSLRVATACWSGCFS